MKLTLGKKQSQSASVLLVTVIIASLFGMFLYYYLNVVASQRAMVTRSQGWNAALSCAEAGVEEVLAQLNPGASRTTNINRSANGWGPLTSGFYGPRTRSFSSGNYTVCFTDDRWPVIYSTGTVYVAAIPATLQRVVRVTTTNAPLLTAAMAVRYNINFTGNGVTTDSFDSTNPALSTNGRYDPTKTSTNGNVASFGGFANIGNGNVHGALLLGPTATSQIGANGVVTGGVHNDFNMDFDEVILPETTWTTAFTTPTIIDGITYNYVFSGSSLQDYTIANLTGNLYVNSNAVIRLYLTGDAAPTTVHVAAGGKLTIYMAGNNFSLSGSSVVDGGVASALTYYGLSTNRRISISGNASFTGVLYAPNADLSLSGGGNSVYDFVGSIVARSATVNGNFNFHFDEALLANGPMRPYAPNSWAEL